MSQIRIAEENDLDTLAVALLQLANYHRHTDPSPYSQGLPKTKAEMQALARRFFEQPQATALVAEDNDEFRACMLAEIDRSSMPSSGMQAVGHIQFVWVEATARGQGFLAELTAEVEAWFKREGVEVVELAYMAANQLAAAAWAKLGYNPFRSFAYKNLSI